MQNNQKIIKKNNIEYECLKKILEYITKKEYNTND